MNWYLAKMVFRIVCGEGFHKPQFDEQFRFIHAGNREEALQKALDTGKSEEDRFLNIHKQPVHWKFINVPELHKVVLIEDGAEVFSKIKEVDDGDNYLYIVNQKAKLLAANL